MTERAIRYLQILELEVGASPSELKEAYRALAKVWHPDRFTGDPKMQRKADEKFKTINEAYGWLSKNYLAAAYSSGHGHSAPKGDAASGHQRAAPGSKLSGRQRQNDRAGGSGPVVWVLHELRTLLNECAGVLVIVGVFLVGGGALSAWDQHVSGPRDAGLRKENEKRAAARGDLEAQEATLANQRDHDFSQDGRWLFLTTDSHHNRYFFDLQTVEPDKGSEGLFLLIRRTSCPSFPGVSSYELGCSLYDKESTWRTWLSCREQLVNWDANSPLSKKTAPQRDTVDDFILRWMQSSKFCSGLRTEARAPSKKPEPSQRNRPRAAEPLVLNVDPATRASVKRSWRLHASAAATTVRMGNRTRMSAGAG